MMMERVWLQARDFDARDRFGMKFWYAAAFSPTTLALADRQACGGVEQEPRGKHFVCGIQLQLC